MRVLFTAVFASVLLSAANAADFAKAITGDDGLPVCTVQVADGASCPEGKILTLRTLSRNALHANFPDEQNLTGDEKFKRAELAQRLLAGDLKLKVEETALIKKLVGKLYGPIVVYQAWTELEAGR